MTENKHFKSEDVGDEDIKWTGNPKLESQIGGIISGLIMIPFAGIGILILIGIYIKVNYTTYAVTDKALYHKKGMLSDKTKRVPLTKIQNTEYSRSWIEKQFEFGTVEISTAGSSGKELKFDAVPEPQEVQEMINKLSQEYKNNQQNSDQVKRKETDEDIKEEVVETRKNLEAIVEYLENEK